MRQDILERWCNALESDEYKQGRGLLRGPDGFCCLGVLCDLHAKQTGAKWVRNTFHGWEVHDYSYLGQVTHLPDQVVKWAGLPDNCPRLLKEEGEGCNVVYATDLNDEGVTFKEIARRLRKTFKE